MKDMGINCRKLARTSNNRFGTVGNGLEHQTVDWIVWNNSVETKRYVLIDQKWNCRKSIHTSNNKQTIGSEFKDWLAHRQQAWNCSKLARILNKQQAEN
jgi:hypothetical protein